MISRILKSGRKYKAENISVYCDTGAQELPDKFVAAFLISKSAGTAVLRNRIKRWMREDFRLLQQEDPKEGEFIVRFYGSAESCNHNRVTELLNQIYSRIGIDA